MTGLEEEAPANSVPAAAIYKGTPKAKAALWVLTDAGVQKHRERTGLDTLVVHAVNDECSPLVYVDQGPS
ncbi:unnamed protein product [Lathyrus sativus]|nr:unnamed protein product [Lathyrus sativus]